MTTSQRYSAVLDYFRNNVPIAESELHFGSDYELLVSVILSAQCTDKRVNLITPALFGKYPGIEAMSKASAEDIYPFIKSVSYPNNKAKNLAAMDRKCRCINTLQRTRCCSRYPCFPGFQTPWTKPRKHPQGGGTGP